MSLLKLNALKNLCAKVTGISVEDNGATTIAEAIDKIADNYSGAGSDEIVTTTYSLDRDCPEFDFSTGSSTLPYIKRRASFGYLTGRLMAENLNNGKAYESCLKQYTRNNGKLYRYICKLGESREFDLTGSTQNTMSFKSIELSYNPTDNVSKIDETLVTVKGSLLIRNAAADYNESYPEGTCGVTSGYVLLFDPEPGVTIPETIYYASLTISSIPILWTGDL